MGDDPHVSEDTPIECLADLAFGVAGLFFWDGERATEILVDIVGPEFGQRSLSVRRVFVSSNGDSPHRWRLDDGHRDGLLLALSGELGSSLIVTT